MCCGILGGADSVYIYMIVFVATEFCVYLIHLVFRDTEPFFTATFYGHLLRFCPPPLMFMCHAGGIGGRHDWASRARLRRARNDVFRYADY